MVVVGVRDEAKACELYEDAHTGGDEAFPDAAIALAANVGGRPRQAQERSDGP
jgi:hypothetical protein